MRKQGQFIENEPASFLGSKDTPLKARILRHKLSLKGGKSALDGREENPTDEFLDAIREFANAVKEKQGERNPTLSL